jgi:hypothetical protein
MASVLSEFPNPKPATAMHARQLKLSTRLPLLPIGERKIARVKGTQPDNKCTIPIVTSARLLMDFTSLKTFSLNLQRF